MDPQQEEPNQDELFYIDQDAWEHAVVKEAQETWEELGTSKARRDSCIMMEMVSVSREREQALLIIKELFEEWGMEEEEEGQG